MTAALRILEPGFRTTVQDLGRAGFQRYGVPVSGALDATALAAANLLVGNPPATAALEIALTGPVLEVAADGARFAGCGSGMTLEVQSDGAPRRVAPLATVTLGRGQRLRVIAPTGSAVGYLAVAGGLNLAPVLGSRSTHLRSGIGGLAGRALMRADLVPLALAAPPPGPDRAGPPLDLARPDYLRVLVATAGGDFSAAALAAFLDGTYTVTAAADRMGLRLAGPIIEPRQPGEALSEGLAPGAIQVPGDGQPILLLADRQTTGGYPRVAYVVSADLPAAGRLRPGDAVRFAAVTMAEAAAARAALADDLARFAAGIVAADPGNFIDPALLAAQNLVSGVVSGEESG